MIQISKMADYGIVLLTKLACDHGISFPARNLSAATGLPLPMVSKVLKKLTNEGIITSTRGVNGGYCLDRTPENISAIEIIVALDGPIAITRCIESDDSSCCNITDTCSIKNYWELINDKIVESISTVNLSDLLNDNCKVKRSAV